MKFSIHLFLLSLVVFITSPVNGQNTTLTEQECIAFAQNIENEFKSGRPEILNKSFDIGEFMKIVNKGIKNSSYQANEQKEFKQGFESKFKFGEEIYNGVKDGGYYDFLKYYSEGKTHHVVFRAFSQNMGLNYHDYELVKKDGKIKIVDCFVMVSGENLSTTVRNLILNLLASLESDNDDETSQMMTDLTTTKKIREFIRSENYEEALAQHKTLSEDFKDGKIARIMLIQILVHLDEEEYAKEIDSYEQKFPKDPNLSLILLDGYIIRENYDKALECLNVLESKYGQDFVLEFYKGNLYVRKAEYPTAASYYEKATKGHEDFKAAYETWLIASLDGNNYAQAYDLSLILNQKFAVAKKDLKLTFAGYSDFMKSSEYKKLNKELK